MLDNNFCKILEYRLTSAFKNSDDVTLKGFWCDGIVLPLDEKEYSPKTINDTRLISAMAYVGKTGQDEYRLIIKFGNKTLSRYARNLDIKGCIPDADEKNFYIIETNTKQITIQLH